MKRLKKCAALASGMVAGLVAVFGLSAETAAASFLVVLAAGAFCWMAEAKAYSESVEYRLWRLTR